jgi:ATP-dependent helicase/DNAse subunit B
MPKYASDKKISYIADEEFTETFEKLKYAVGELAENMKKGYSEALPEKIGTYMPCEFCDYKMVCRYESKAVKEDE